jgi:hypothetical protein
MASDSIAGLLVVERGRHRFEPIKDRIVSNTSHCLIAKAIRQIWRLTTTPSIPSGVESVHFIFVSV